MAGRGLDPDTHAPRHVPPEEVARRRKINPLSVGMDRLALIFNEADDDTDLAMGVFDTDGVLLWRAGEARWLAVADQLQLVEGAVWDEASVNTTAISLVIADSRPIRVVGADHYNSALHGLYCAAAPIHDPRTGVLLGVVGLAGPADHVQPASTALATTMAALAEHEVVAAHHRSLAELRKSAGAQLAATRGPALLVDRDGWIADSRGCTPPDAVAAPDVGAHQFVPGIGTCVATAVGSGWLLRRVGPSNPIVAELDLRGEPSLTVAGDGDEWRTVLTRRHAQILLLLAEAKESGLTSARLSRLIFGDTGHVVTVRAEMSRLRRVVGALLASRPYRLAPGVTLQIAPGSVTTAPDVNALGVAPAPPHTPGDARHRRLA
ncbi:GAF domain-containing protein [Gordonia sp. CPCC 205515]|uniref:helix-turn-helix domain-containing protein n=1 Tax=Gordonia sp. CPCC 205515 TaxID=3140791 RepID=UPI003AF3FA8E